MRGFLTLMAAAVVVCGARNGLAAGGTGSGGLGLTAHVSTTTGQATGDGMTSTGISGILHSGGMGVSTGHIPNTGPSSDHGYSTGGSKPMAGGKGRGTENAQSKVYNVPMVRGIGLPVTTAGGRGI